MTAPFLVAHAHAEPAKTAARSLQNAPVITATTAENWKSTAAAHVATNAVKKWIIAFVKTAKNVSAARMIASAKTDLRSNSLSRATVPAALIYHNICCTPDMKKPASRASVVDFTSMANSGS